MSNFDPNSVNNLVGLWDFIAGNETADTGLDDGVAQNGAFFGNGSASGDRAHFDGHGDRFDVSGNDDPFDMSKGTIEVQYRQDSHIGTSPDTLVSRGEYADRGSEGYFSISVQLDGSVQVIHCDGGGEEAVVTTDAGLVSPGDHVNVKYSWDEDTGVQLIVENGTSGESQTVVDDTTGLTMEIGDNDDENFTFAAREEDDGDYDRFFDGSIDYVAIYESEATGPDGAVDGEAFGEVMELGYDDSNAPTDQGGDMITNDADLIFGNGGDDTIDGAAGDDTIFGDDGGSAPPVREIFQWSEAPGFASDDDDDDDEADDFTQNTGSANITFTILSEQGNATTDYEGTTQNTDLLDANVDENASMESTTNGDNGSAAYSWTSDVPISNVEFRVNDIDGDGRIRIEAYDADGNLVQVMLSDAGSGLALSDTDGVPGNDTATSTDNNYTDDAADEHSVLVNIAGPIVEFRLYHEQDGNFNTAVNVTDITFDVIAFDPGEAGDDVITGAEGSDQMFGQDGDDTFIVDNASDGDGDVIVGGNGPDDTADNDVLDLRGAGRLTINEVADGSDAGATMGTVTFDSGETLEFSQIETILTDPQNEDPDAMDDFVSVDEDDSVLIAPLANDTDPDGDPLEIVDFTDPSNGTLVDNGDGTFTYTPDPDYNGPDSFTYTVSDGQGGTDTATVNITVDPVNDDPVAVDDDASTDEDTPVVIAPLANDSDVDGDPLEIDSFTQPDNGTVTDNGDGTLTYTPDPDFNGTDTFEYTVSDGNGGSDTATITVEVEPENDAPMAEDDEYDLDEDDTVTFDPTSNDSDPDGDPLEVTDITDPANGTITDNGDGTFTYTPDPDFNGTDEVTYTVDDGNGGTDTATITFNVAPVNDDPVAEDDDASTDEDTPVVIAPLANDSDVDGDPLEIDSFTQPDNGTVTDNGDGTLTYTPDPDFNGTDTFEYTVSDGNGGSDTATITVEVEPENDAPMAEDDEYDLDEDDTVTFDPTSNDSDPDGDPLEVTDITDPANGTITDNGDGTFTYTPDPDFNGTDEVTYTVDDGNGGTDTATITFNVAPVNDDPDAQDDNQSTLQGTPVVVAVLANDSDVDGDPLMIDSFTQPPNGTVTDNGDGTLTYTPDPAFVGTDTFEYTVSDGNGGFDTATVDVRVDDVIGPVDGLDSGENMGPGYTDLQGDQIDGFDGDDDTIFGNGGDDTIDSGEGDDTVDGGGGDDFFDINDEGDGIDNDVIIGGETDEDGRGDVVDTSDILDDLLVEFSGPEEGTITDGDDTTSFEEIEVLQLGPGDDTVIGAEGDENVLAGGGDDSLVGNDGDDTLDGSVGEDTIDGGDGDDSLLGGFGDDTIIGGDGSDYVEDFDGDNTIDTSGGGAVPLPDLGYPGLFPGDVDFNGPGADMNDLDTVFSGSGDDTITTGDDDDYIDAGTGDNVIDAGFDDDTIITKFGDDLIIGGEGSDTISAGAGDDTIYGGLDPMFPDELNITDEDTGGVRPDLVPNNGKDFIDGGAGADLIFGQDDDDTIFGGGGEDTIDGGIDDDLIYGGNLRDSITGGQGADTMFGDGGADRFIINEREDAFGDVVVGGNTGNDNDTLDLRNLGRLQLRDADGNIADGVDDPDLIDPTDLDAVRGTAEFLDADGNVEGILEFSQIENLLICFTPGVAIATPRGEMAVEDLKPGDRVITRDDGVQEIRWIGRKPVTAMTLHADPSLRPVLIRRGALGNGLPERDMLVSPNHRMLMANEHTHMLFDEREVLVAAKHLVGQPGIERADVPGTEYIHLLFDRHEVILGDGAWTESFHPGDYSLKGIDREQRDEIFKLFPELMEAEGLKNYGAARHSLKAYEAKMLREGLMV